MRYLFILIICSCASNLSAQAEGIRDQWRRGTKLKLDLLNFNDEYPSLMFGVEYPFRNKLFALEHELGPIFNLSYTDRTIDRSSGFKTSHTVLMYSDRNDWVIGLGAHFRLLTVEGQITACGGGSSGNVGGCSFFRLIDDPIDIYRWATYARIRRLTLLRRRVTFAFGMDLGIFTQSIRNPEFETDDLSFRTQFWRQNLNRTSGAYFRIHAQFLYRLGV